VCRFGGWTLEGERVVGNSSQTQAKVWFNNKGYHAIPAYYNALTNNLLRAAVHPSHANDYGNIAFSVVLARLGLR
jgi:hypothetical protein